MTNKDGQVAINETWKRVWAEQGRRGASGLFENRFFIESYPILKKHFPLKSSRALEIGTGSGRYGLAFAKDFPGCHFAITDILEESVGLALALAKDLNLKNTEVGIQDTFQIKYPDNYFDVVWSDAVIQHLPNQAGAIKEMQRVLKPGGILMISVVNFWNPHTIYKSLKGVNYEYGYEKSFKKRELNNLLQSNGLKIVANDGFYAGYGLYRLKRIYKIFGFAGRVFNRGIKTLDRFSNRFFSKKFGFEIVSVGQKPY